MRAQCEGYVAPFTYLNAPREDLLLSGLFVLYFSSYFIALLPFVPMKDSIILLSPSSALWHDADPVLKFTSERTAGAAQVSYRNPVLIYHTRPEINKPHED